MPVTSVVDSGGLGTKGMAAETPGTDQEFVEVKLEVIVVENGMAFFDATALLLEAHKLSS